MPARDSSSFPLSFLFAALLLLGLLQPSVGHAQTMPDAGSLRQQIEQQRELPLPPAARGASVSPPPPAEPRAGLSVTVTSFRFVGNQLLSAEQLTPAVAPFTGRPLGFDGLQRAADAVAAAYREAGWLARVVLPEQEVSGGVVTLQVVEARYAGIRFEGEVAQRVPRARIEAHFAQRQAVGAPLNADALDRALLLADDLPGVSVAGTLAPGQSEGQTALVVRTTDEPLIYGDVGYDNTGARATGADRVTANLNVNSPTGRGEAVGLNLLHSRGSDYGRIALTAPWGHDGLRWGVNASAMNYTVIDGPGANSAAQVQGRSDSVGLDLTYPLLRSRARNLYLSAGADEKRFLTRDTQLRSDYRSASLHLGLSGNRFDDWAGGGASSASVQLLQGRLFRMQAHTLLESIERDYRKLSYSLSRQQALWPDHTLYLALSGQHATQGLDSSEKFYIGGAQSVRAYPSSELGGERGQALNAEWRWRVQPAWTVTAFANLGRVVQLPATAGDQPAVLNLRGHGAAVTWQAPRGVVAQVSWSRRNGANPRPTSTGTDGDGTLVRDRVWVNVTLPF